MPKVICDIEVYDINENLVYLGKAKNVSEEQHKKNIELVRQYQNKEDSRLGKLLNKIDELEKEIESLKEEIKYLKGE